eukprot:scaffold248389_cov51-Cyclotella_meneghiniana.AAC.1
MAAGSKTNKNRVKYATNLVSYTSWISPPVESKLSFPNDLRSFLDSLIPRAAALPPRLSISAFGLYRFPVASISGDDWAMLGICVRVIVDSVRRCNRISRRDICEDVDCWSDFV